MDFCPNCNYSVLPGTVHCPQCGYQLTHPRWKKIGAWILLVVIAYGLVKCHLRLLEGFEPRKEGQSQTRRP